MDLITCSKKARLFFNSRSWKVGALYAATVELTTGASLALAGITK
jgi:hypothetical protein